MCLGSWMIHATRSCICSILGPIRPFDLTLLFSKPVMHIEHATSSFVVSVSPTFVYFPHGCVSLLSTAMLVFSYPT